MRADYIGQQKSRAPAHDIEWRIALHDWINGGRNIADESLAAMFDAHCVTTVVAETKGKTAAAFGAQMRRLGGPKPSTLGGFSVYRLDKNCAAR